MFSWGVHPAYTHTHTHFKGLVVPAFLCWKVALDSEAPRWDKALRCSRDSYLSGGESPSPLKLCSPQLPQLTKMALEKPQNLPCGGKSLSLHKAGAESLVWRSTGHWVRTPTRGALAVLRLAMATIPMWDVGSETSFQKWVASPVLSLRRAPQLYSVHTPTSCLSSRLSLGTIMFHQHRADCTWNGTVAVTAVVNTLTTLAL